MLRINMKSKIDINRP